MQTRVRKETINPTLKFHNLLTLMSFQTFMIFCIFYKNVLFVYIMKNQWDPVLFGPQSKYVPTGLEQHDGSEYDFLSELSI